MLQELHLTAEAIKVKTRHLAAAGYILYAQASPSSEKGNPFGGFGIAIKAHPGPCKIDAFHVGKGCGFLAASLRVRGSDCTWISMYLESGTGLDSAINEQILFRLRSIVGRLHGVWVVGGDFNCPINEFLATRHEELLQGRTLSPGVRFFVVHSRLASLVRLTISFEVPFKPHGLLRFDLQVADLQTRVPTLSLQKGDQGRMYSQAIDDVRVSDVVAVERSCVKLAEWSRTTQKENDLQQGKGFSIQVVREILASNPSGLGIWKGGDFAVWDRRRSWLQTRNLPSKKVALSTVAHSQPWRLGW